MERHSREMTNQEEERKLRRNEFIPRAKIEEGRLELERQKNKRYT